MHVQILRGQILSSGPADAINVRQTLREDKHKTWEIQETHSYRVHEEGLQT